MVLLHKYKIYIILDISSDFYILDRFYELFIFMD